MAWLWEISAENTVMKTLWWMLIKLLLQHVYVGKVLSCTCFLVCLLVLLVYVGFFILYSAFLCVACLFLFVSFKCILHSWGSAKGWHQYDWKNMSVVGSVLARFYLFLCLFVSTVLFSFDVTQEDDTIMTELTFSVHRNKSYIEEYRGFAFIAISVSLWDSLGGLMVLELH